MPSLPAENRLGAGKVPDAIGLEEALRNRNTAIIGDTLYLETLGIHDLDGTTINPANILETVTSVDISYHVWAAAKMTIEERVSRGIADTDLTKATMERFLFELGNVILDRVEGPHFTFVDPRRHENTTGMIKNAQRLISLYEEKGIPRSKVVVSIPATHEGVAAVQELESKHKIHTNLYLVSSLMHAAACAEAGATTITISVGRLLHWHERRRNATYKDLKAHPGIETIQSILEYFSLHGIKSKVIGSDFRVLSEIGPVGGFDAICVTKYQADRLKWSAVNISAPLAESSASLRARQAQYPTKLLQTGTGFLDTMSVGTRNMVTTTLFTALGEMGSQMDNLERIIATEVKRQHELLTLDLKSLYRSPKSRRKENRYSSSERGPKQSLAKALHLDYDENEIF